jgi:cytidyltransferase-like protein
MRIVYSYYVMDVVHRGHLTHMKNCKEMAGPDGISIVGILTDKAVMERKPKPVLSLDERMEIARSIRFNDLVVPQETYSPIPNVKAICPDIVAESTSHKKEDVEELRKATKARVVALPYFPDQSSTKIKNDIRNRHLNEK